MVNKVVITQPQGEVFTLQLSSKQRKELQRRPKTCALLTTELNLQVFQQKITCLG